MTEFVAVFYLWYMNLPSTVTKLMLKAPHAVRLPGGERGGRLPPPVLVLVGVPAMGLTG